MSETLPTLSIELQEKILNLEKAILERLPQMPGILQDIWIALKKQPENVTLLGEEDVQKIVAGLEIQTNTKLMDIAMKSTKSPALGKKLKGLTADDL